MKNIDLEELKRIEFNLLVQFDEIANENGFRYTIAGGTLLGAVRHKGFIPWDDDIDISMPRPDYNKFIDYCKKEQTPFKLICHETDNRYGYLFAKIADKRTVIEEENGNRENAELGVYIDIFPIDGLGNSLEEAKEIFAKTSFKRELLVAANWKRYFRSKRRPLYQEMIRFPMYLISRFMSYEKLIKSIEKIYLNIDFNECKYVGCICGVYRLKDIFPQKVYSKYTKLEFEGRKFNAIADSDCYLSQFYGDYMKLPPIEKRKTHHTFKAYYKFQQTI